MTEMITNTETTLATEASNTEWFNDLGKFELIQRVAKVFSTSDLVPDIYRGAKGIGSCVIAFNIAARMKLDPLMVMQNLYIIHGKPGWSSQFMISAWNRTGRFGPIQYTFTGTPGSDDWSCSASSTDLASGVTLTGTTVSIRMAKAEGWYQKKGSKWQTIPEQMMRYRAATFMVRAYAPELTMGVPTADENRDVYDPGPVQSQKSEVVKAIESLPIEGEIVPSAVAGEFVPPTDEEIRNGVDVM